MSDRGRAWSAGGVTRAVTAAAVLLAGWVLPIVALAADAPPDPDAACAQEKTFKSTAGTTKATLTIINNTDQAVQSLWLDYTGKRVHYERVDPHKQYKQPTWLTHPWVVASANGTCYRLVVMTSLEQTVTLNPGTGGTIATPQPIASPTQVATAPATPVATRSPIPTPAPVPTAAPVATIAPLPDPGISTGTGATPPDNTLGLVLGAGAVAAAGAAVAAYWAAHTGKAWWGTDDPSPAAKTAPASAPEPELTYTGHYYDQFGRPLADEQVTAYNAAVDAWVAAGAAGSPPAAPSGNPDLPANEQIAQQQAERRIALTRDSLPAMFIQDTAGNYYDPSGRPIPKPQMDAFWRDYEAWEARGDGDASSYPRVPRGDPNAPISEEMAKVEAERRARAADQGDPAYLYVPLPKP